MEDCASLGVIAPAAYVAAYAWLWNDVAALSEQLATYSAAAMASFMARPDAAVWLAEAEGAMVGFLTMVAPSPDPILGIQTCAELPRIYLLPGAQRLGLGRLMQEEAVREARRLGFTHVWLDVMDSAPHAIAAYQRWGYKVIGETRFDRKVRSDLAGMLVLHKALT